MDNQCNEKSVDNVPKDSAELPELHNKPVNATDVPKSFEPEEISVRTLTRRRSTRERKTKLS